MNLRKTGIAICLAAMMLLTGCAGNGAGKAADVAESTDTEITKETGKTAKNGKDVVSAPPEIALTDPLSGQKNSCSLRPGGYTWSYRLDGELSGAVADGSHPLDEAGQKGMTKLAVPQYRDAEAVTYTLSCEWEPDEITISQWNIEDVGNFHAEPVYRETYEKPVTLVKLEAGYVYEIVMAWTEENLDQNGFYGQAGYALITEEANAE